MNIDRLVFMIAGSFILISVALGFFINPYWFLFTVFVGANMVQASITGFCPLVMILKKLGFQPGKAFN